MAPVTEFWLSVVNAFGALNEAVFQSVYSKIDKTKPTPTAAQHYVKDYYVSFPSTVPFTTIGLFEEGEGGAHDFCNKVARSMTGAWTPLLSKRIFNDKEITLLKLGMRLTSTLPEVHQGWIGDNLPSTTITDA